ncbi:hypothetical protein CDAR_524781 [Caerostris darwini]|uniref:Uncharacterized protein n=1 Tax=Caerostris darwini TaxID=1538125 RepID=A0AAV4QW68_9ARAC|nr:hypothetical protein CDAR_524781 [Caerostris darwini]
MFFTTTSSIHSGPSIEVLWLEASAKSTVTQFHSLVSSSQFGTNTPSSLESEYDSTEFGSTEEARSEKWERGVDRAGVGRGRPCRVTHPWARDYNSGPLGGTC